MIEEVHQQESSSTEDLRNGTPAPSKRKRTWMKVLIVFLVAILILIGSIWIAGVIARNALTDALAEARKVDPLLTFKEIEAARRTWPPGKNGADIIIALVDELNLIKKETENLEHLPVLGEGDLPPLGQRWDEQTRKTVTTELEKRVEILSKIDQLKQYEGGRFPLTIPANPYDIDLTHLDILRTSLKLKDLQCLYRIMVGESAHLADDFDILIKHGLLLADEPSLISAMMRTACESHTVDTLQYACALCTLQPVQIELISDRLAMLDTKDCMLWGMRGERAIFIQGFEWFAQQTVGYPIAPSKSGESPKSRGLFQFVLDRDKKRGLEIFNLHIRAAQDPQATVKIEEEAEKKKADLPFYALLSKIFASSFSRSFVLNHRCLAENRTARVALAVEQYRIDSGTWPEQFEQLVPKYMDEIPIDPFDGKPLRYKRTDDEIIVYSVGDDRTDDGGQVEHRTSQKTPPDWGFVLLHPAKRGVAPTTQPEADALNDKSDDG